VSTEVPVLIVASLVTAAMGAMGGIGGAVLLVPLLVVSGMDVSQAAPLGLVSAAALSVAAAPKQLSDRLVNHRIGVTTETAATAGAVVGAMVSNLLANTVLVWFLATVALVSAFAGGRRTGVRNPANPALGPDDVGERVGAFRGAYPLADGVAPYRLRRLRVGLGLMSVAGFVAGTAGVSGGFIKTPVTSEVMHVPTKVAAATTIFTIGITSASALTVFAIQGRIVPLPAAGIVVGSLLGGRLGAGLQSRMPPTWTRRGMSVMLVIVSVVMVVTS
jgi:uncharacterized membrane protein YfcA